MKKRLKLATFLTISTLNFAGCVQRSESFNDYVDTLRGRKQLYVASGACYAGGVATSIGASTVTAFDIESGQVDRVVVDYNMISPGDSPVSIVEYDATRILVLVENAAGRRIDLVEKDGSSVSTYVVNGTALSAVLRKMVLLPDYSLLVSKSSAVEKFSAAKSRVTQGVNPYINAPGLGCATSTTLISDIVPLNNGKIIYTHAAATPNNKIGLISATGYASTADCLTSVASPTTTALPTSALQHSSGALIVTFGSTTASSNFIYGYDVNSSANIINNAVASFADMAIVNGPTSIIEDTDTGDVFVANGNANFNTIEKFYFDSSTKILSRLTVQPFIGAQIYTRCVTDMKVVSK